jgi:hypothetical protein
MSAYSPAEIIERRIECLIAMGMPREAAEKIVKETAGPA